MNRHAKRRTAAGLGLRLGAAGVVAGLVLAAVLAVPAAEKAEKKVAHIPGSRFTYIHRLPLAGPEGNPITLKDDPVLPFSYRHSCTKCHDYDVVRTGWHFNAPDADVPPGRPGQPWFWADQTTGTAIPLSYRAWPNCWRPDEVGMSTWTFVLNFGRHLPGGGPGEKTDVKDKAARWLVSGKLEINCGSCHSGDPAYDQVENFLQVARQNLMWAATASTSLATVTGAAAGMPPFYDPIMGPEDEKAAEKAPAVHYDASRFGDKGAVFLDLPSEPPDRRCYFCHSTAQVGDGSPEVWQTDEDVHMLSGLTCTDCHRHGLDHNVIRGYEGEPLAEGKPHLATLTCRGCHLGDESAEAGPHTMGSRLGAPVPAHVGLPTIHLEKLACTTCHAGLVPGERTKRVQTSMAHALEFQGPHRGRHALPYIVEPVFVHRDYDGTIGPVRMVWPAFWARIVPGEGEGAGDTLKPMGPSEVFAMAEDAFKANYEAEAPTKAEAAPKPAETEAAPAPAAGEAAEGADDPADAAPAAPEAAKPAEAEEPADAAKAAEPEKPAVAEDELEGLTAPKPNLPPAKVKAVLAALAAKEKGTAFGYVCAGRLHRLDESGNLAAAEHPRAEPVSWPIGHNVRPAEYALGATACTECHGFSAPMAVGEVEVASPAHLGDPATEPMYAFQGRDPMQLKAWAMSYLFRPMFKVVGFATAAVIAAFLLAYLVRGMVGVARWAARKAPSGPTV
ncbi:MAG: hypothetical protein ISS74_03505 [Planctomycetes bacterium]|nr:hypothetical protein [Planctomycetota bacterium]